MECHWPEHAPTAWRGVYFWFYAPGAQSAARRDAKCVRLIKPVDAEQIVTKVLLILYYKYVVSAK